MLSSLILATLASTTPSCNETKICTREYIPTICSYESQTVLGSNKCTAMNKLENLLCDEGITLDESKVVCKEENAKPAPQQKVIEVEAVSCETIRMCTLEYLPTSCTYNGQVIEGSNLCQTKLKVEALACDEGLEGEAITMTCESKPLGLDVVLY